MKRKPAARLVSDEIDLLKAAAPAFNLASPG
jgi:hypothetical protein